MEYILIAGFSIFVLLIKPINIILSARRIGLRDKGKTEFIIEDEREICWTHSDCNTRTRIGIDKKGDHVEYCWRCECIISSDQNFDPDDGETVIEDNCGSNVVHIDLKKYA